MTDSQCALSGSTISKAIVRPPIVSCGLWLWSSGGSARIIWLLKSRQVNCPIGPNIGWHPPITAMRQIHYLRADSLRCPARGNHRLGQLCQWTKQPL